MRSQVNFENARLIEALDYIDRDLIAEVIDEIKAPDMRQSPERDKKVTRKSIRYALTLAACMLLLGAVIPVISYLIRILPIGPGGNPGTDTTEDVTEETQEPIGYDYIITEEDLDMINSAYKLKYNVQMKNFRIYKSVDEVMNRNPYVSYYFGKYGDTIIIWCNDIPDKKCCFKIAGYDFDFYIGTVRFIKGDKWYDHTDMPEEILTSEEAKVFYDAFTEYLIPLLRKEYKILNFTEGLESISLEEMKKINDAYETWNFDRLFASYMNNGSSDRSEDDAYKYAYIKMGYDPHRFFNEEKFEEYQYYGKINGKAVIATENPSHYGRVSTGEIAGYKFVLKGIETYILIYSDGKVTELSEAFKQNLISENEIAVIHERHNAYFYYFAGGRKEEPIPEELQIMEYDEEYTSPIELNNNEIREIVWEYIDSDKELNNFFGVKCYGKFDGAYAVMIDGPFMYTQELRSETVAGYTFSFNSSKKLYIYNEGIFHSLVEAYERGIITKENVAAIEWDKTAQ